MLLYRNGKRVRKNRVEAEMGRRGRGFVEVNKEAVWKQRNREKKLRKESVVM